MAKMKRTTIGSIVKGKEGKPDYIKVRNDVTLKAGQYLNLESKAAQLASVEAAVAAGKLSGDLATQIKERLNKIPDFVRFEIIALSSEE